MPTTLFRISGSTNRSSAKRTGVANGATRCVYKPARPLNSNREYGCGKESETANEGMRIKRTEQKSFPWRVIAGIYLVIWRLRRKGRGRTETRTETRRRGRRTAGKRGARSVCGSATLEQSAAAFRCSRVNQQSRIQ